MAEKPKGKKDKKPEAKKHGGEMNFGIEILIFIVIIFILWILAGGPKKEQPKSPILKQDSTQVIPNGGYGQIPN
ncbi:MAG TPA: hypothetical protein VIK86_06770 [Candidatus Paceibacterota bacterium]